MDTCNPFYHCAGKTAKREIEIDKRDERKKQEQKQKSREKANKSSTKGEEAGTVFSSERVVGSGHIVGEAVSQQTPSV